MTAYAALSIAVARYKLTAAFVPVVVKTTQQPGQQDFLDHEQICYNKYALLVS